LDDVSLPLKIAIDTGSAVSIISAEVLAQCTDDMLLSRHLYTGAMPVDANQQPLTVLGEFVVPISIGPTKFTLPLLCVPGFPYDILLGNDVLVPNHVVINYQQSPYLEINGNRVAITTASIDTVLLLKLDQEVQIPARTELLLSLKTGLPADSSGTAMVEGVANLHQ
jgi:hypothetical protein